ncbi:hypothetical protein S101446_03298 (plasmid) [Komagataeibacter europaeus]|nr:hypothetical protein S101446_03298 [Komagataeibacter europaeus]
MIEAQKDIALNEMAARLKDSRLLASAAACSAEDGGSARGHSKEDRTCNGAGARRYPETSAGLVRFDDPPDLDPPRLVFIDETCLSTRIARLLGRSLRGECCRAGVPHGRKTITFTAGLLLSGMTAPFVHDGATNSEIFQAYVKHVLMPTLSPGDIVVLDNLPVHEVPGARKVIERMGLR